MKRFNFMRIIRSVLLGLTVVSWLACGDIEDTDDSKSSSGNHVGQVKTSLIDEETAILIAKGFACQDVEFSNHDIKVRESKNYWGIEWVLKKEFQHYTGGGGVVEVDKKTGHVLRFYIGK